MYFLWSRWRLCEYLCTMLLLYRAYTNILLYHEEVDKSHICKPHFFLRILRSFSTVHQNNDLNTLKDGMCPVYCETVRHIPTRRKKKRNFLLKLWSNRLLIAGLLQMIFFAVKYTHSRKYVVHWHSININMWHLDCKLLRRLKVLFVLFCCCCTLYIKRSIGKDDFIESLLLIEKMWLFAEDDSCDGWSSILMNWFFWKWAWVGTHVCYKRPLKRTVTKGSCNNAVHTF